MMRKRHYPWKSSVAWLVLTLFFLLIPMSQTAMSFVGPLMIMRQQTDAIRNVGEKLKNTFQNIAGEVAMSALEVLEMSPPESVQMLSMVSGKQAGEELWSATQGVILPQDGEAGLACPLLSPTPNLSDRGICSQLLDLANRPPSRALMAKRQELFAEAPRLHKQVADLIHRGQYDDALSKAVRALDLSKTRRLTKNQHMAVSLIHLAHICLVKGQYAQVGGVYTQALRHLANDNYYQTSPLTKALIQDGYGHLYRLTGNYAEAESHLREALKLKENNSLVGPQHESVAITLNHLALLYIDKGERYAEAEGHLLRALKLYKPADNRPKHAKIATIHNSLALLYRIQGDYDKADSQLKKAQIEQQMLQTSHPDVAATHNHFAILYHDRGRLREAEEEYKASLGILKKTLGEKHPRVATTLNNLAVLYHDKGDYEQAALDLRKALELRRQAFGSRHPEVALTYNNLAEVYRARGNAKCAQTLYEEAKKIWQKTLDAAHPYLATVKNNLASLSRAKGDYKKAASLLEQILSQRKGALGPQHPHNATTLNNLAELYRVQGNYDKAEQDYTLALEIKKQALGRQHPDVATILHNLAVLYQATGMVDKAVELMTRSADIREYNLSLILTMGSEEQKRAYIATLAGEVHSVITHHTRFTPQNPAARDLAFTTVLRRKGRVLEAMTDNLTILRRRLDPNAQLLLIELASMREQLATLTLQGPRAQSLTQYRDHITTLETKGRQLEAKISTRSAPFRAQSQPITWKRVQQALPPEAALVEVVAYRSFNALAKEPEARFEATRYGAYVLHREGEPKWVDLGEAASIDKLVKEFRQTLSQYPYIEMKRPGSPLIAWIMGFFRRSPAEKHQMIIQKIARELDKQLMYPIRSLLGDSRLVLLSPDGMLNLIPFGVLVDEDNRFLIERFTFSYLTTGRELLRLQATSPRRHRPLIIANPNFNDNGEPTGESCSTLSEIGKPDLLCFEPLPGTAEEAEQLKRLLPTAKLLSQEKATESALRQVQGPWILHVATHAFFLADQLAGVAGAHGPILVEMTSQPNTPNAQDHNPPDSQQDSLQYTANSEATNVPNGKSALPRKPHTAVLENPLLRSGLVLAGANIRPSAKEDGILTALEVTDLDLWGTQLVVLSACQTGVGEVYNGEGVYGLRRTLVMAGAETQVISLWSVSDEATPDLMVGYYKQLLNEGTGRAQALHKVQLAMLKHKRWHHPYYWAGFISSGAWTPLESSSGSNTATPIAKQ